MCAEMVGDLVRRKICISRREGPEHMLNVFVTILCARREKKTILYTKKCIISIRHFVCEKKNYQLTDQNKTPTENIWQNVKYFDNLL